MSVFYEILDQNNLGIGALLAPSWRCARSFPLSWFILSSCFITPIVPALAVLFVA